MAWFDLRRQRAAENRKSLMTNSLNRFKFLAAAGLVLGAAAIFGTAPATSAPSYDGLWSVVIITQSGTCDRAYRYPIRISNGSVLNEGSSPATINGKVASNGAVTVTVSAGSRSANGSGRLSGQVGAGSWRGGDCSGTWEAEKRG
jgi:hypothetical protein